MENNNIEIDLDNEVSPNRSLRSPLSSKNTNLETTVHEIRRKGCKIILFIKKNKKFIFF
jgi:hypothetical protein